MKPPLTPVEPDGWPRGKGYANGVLVPPGRQLLFVAGMVGWDVSQRIVSESLAAQFEQALVNVVAVVTKAGGAPTDIARMLVMVTDRAEYVTAQREIGAAWRRVLGKHFPAMALVEVAALLEPGAKVEIEAIAAV